MKCAAADGQVAAVAVVEEDGAEAKVEAEEVEAETHVQCFVWRKKEGSARWRRCRCVSYHIGVAADV